MDDADALKLAEGVIERVMARQHPGRPAFYSLIEARNALKRAQFDLSPSRFGMLQHETRWAI